MLNTAKDTSSVLLPKSPTGPKLDLGPVVVESKLLKTPLRSVIWARMSD